jgi:uncharacterized protein (DUF305 family)
MTPDASATTTDTDPQADLADRRRRISRRVIALGAATVLVLVGIAIGVGLSRAIDEQPAAATAAGPVEVGFAQDMSVHHLQAVTMGNWARDRSTDLEIRQLGFDISSGQLEQVGRMKGWLMVWDRPEQALGAYMTWTHEPGGHQHGQTPTTTSATDAAPMPGMATSTELTQLRSLTGTALDVRFLQLMLRHHQGGTAMARYAVEHTSDTAVRALRNLSR